MIVRDVTIEQFAKEVKKANKRIVVYGVGVIGKITVPQLLSDLELIDQVLLFVDADGKKQGKIICVGDYQIEIYSPNLLDEIKEEFVILITGSRYEGICSFLNRKKSLDYICSYILPEMLVKAARSFPKYKIKKQSAEPLIPKKIHYCWFGGNAIPEGMQYCINTWKKFCPDYEIIQWDETNYDLSKYTYMLEAYKRQKWAFASDVARLDILYQYGGIYMDTDVELIRSLDDLLYQPGFCGVEKWRIVNTGGGCGVVAGHPMIAHMLKERKKVHFIYEDGTINEESSGTYESMPLVAEGFRPNNTVQTVNGMTIYSSDFFHPYDYMSKECCITENTFGIHRFFGSWV